MTSGDGPGRCVAVALLAAAMLVPALQAPAEARATVPPAEAGAPPLAVEAVTLADARAAIAGAEPAPAIGLPGRAPSALRPIGRGRMTWFGLRVYDAMLWTIGGERLADDFTSREFVLELRYARTLAGPAIAERTAVEMARLQFGDDALRTEWTGRMRELFPDVAEGDRITGWHRPGEPVRFFHNGRETGQIAHPQFARAFFGIWLDARTTEPDLRKALLGAAPATPQ